VTRVLLLWAGLLFIVTSVAINITGEGFTSVVRISMLLFGFAWLLNRFPKFRFRPVPPTVVALICLTLLTFLSYIWSIDPNASYEAGWRLLYVCAAAFLIYDTFRSEKEVWMAMQGYIMGLFLLFVQLLQAFVSGRVSIDAGRIGAVGIHPNHAAVMLATGLPIAWQLANDTRYRNPVTALLNYSYPVLALVGVVLTGSRGGTIACIPGLILIGLQIIRNPLGLVAVSIGGLAAFPVLLSSPAVQANIERLGTITEAAGESDGFTGRGARWQAAIDLFGSSPIYGVGAGGYRIGSYRIGNYGFDEAGTILGAHSVYLQYAAELGVIGVGLFMIMMLVTLRRYMRIAPGYRAAFVTGLVSLIIAMISEMLDARYFVWCYITIGLALAAVPRRQDVAVDPPRALDHLPQPETVTRPMSGVGQPRA
jgi:O-antigen ligase